MIISLTFLCETSKAQNKTPKDWKCNNKVSGKWNFGLAPSACDVSPFMNSKEAQKLYAPLIFLTQSNTNQERKRYMQELYPALRDFADYYIQTRKPNVSNAEKAAWRKAIFTIAHQESFWSHYRKQNNRIKMMRGDFGHGHGIMQIDDRWHFASINNGVAANLIQNFIYALEIYYTSWERAPKQSCVSSPNQWVARTRSAYSAYNGGAGSICRWTNPNHKWSRNDKNFYDKFKSQSWLKYVGNTQQAASVNVRCLAENKSQCSPGDGKTPPPSQDNFTDGYFYQTQKGKVCAYKDSQFHCIESSKDMACLNLYLGTNQKKTHSIKVNDLKKHRWIAHDRHRLCIESVENLLPIANHILTQKDMTLLNDKKAAVREISDGEKLYLKDFQVMNDDPYTIYYKVLWKSKEYYIKSGSHKSPEDNFALLANDEDLQSLAQVGDVIKINNKQGINQRESVKGKYIQNIPQGTEVEILGREMRGTEGRSYFLVLYKNKKGYIYGGQLNPSTIYKWTELIRDQQDATKASLKSHLWYVMPKECPSLDCKNTKRAVWSSKKTKRQDEHLFIVLEEKEDWLRIYSKYDNAQGWIKKEVTNEY